MAKAIAQVQTISAQKGKTMATKRKSLKVSEAALAELDTIVQQLERGELPLTQALDAF